MFTYNSKDSSNNGLRSQFLILVDRGSTWGNMCFGSRDSWTKGSLEPVMDKKQFYRLNSDQRHKAANSDIHLSNDIQISSSVGSVRTPQIQDLPALDLSISSINPTE